jgi:1-acyl-sn-glycerol-3-phosphate acyltransferase
VVNGLQKSLVAELRLCGTRFQVERAGALSPGRPTLFVSNHQSMFDIPILGAILSSHYLKFVSKRELARRWIPSISYNLRRGGNALIDRGDRAEAVEAIRKLGVEEVAGRGVSVVIFPEGTRARGGVLGPFRPQGTLALMAAVPAAPVVPVAIDNSWRLLEHGLRPAPFGTRVRVFVGAPIERAPQEDPGAVVQAAQQQIEGTLARWRSEDASASAAPRARRARAGLVAAILVLAAVVRFWGLGFGLPHTESRPDESVIVGLAQQFWSGDLNPRFFRYPTLQMYLTAAVFGADYAEGRVRGRYGSIADFRQAMIEDAAPWHLWARALTASLGILTVLVVYRLAAAVFRPDTGLAAAFLLSLTYLHARDSHFATTDVPLTFFLMAAVWFTWRVLVRGRTADYAWAGILAGLAMATKYLGLMMALPLLLAHLMRPRPAGRSPLDTAEVGKVVLFGASLVFVFLAATPFALPEWRMLWRDLHSDWDYARRGYWMVFGRAWSLHPRVFLWHGLGAPQLLAGAAGLALFAVRRPREAAVVLGFPVAYSVLTARDQLVFARYAIPLVPFLCIGAAFLLTSVAERVTRRWPRVPAGAVLALGAVSLVAPSARSVLRLDRVLSRTDTRVVLRSWIEGNVAPADGVYQAADKWSAVQLPASPAAILGRYEGPANKERRRVLLRQAEARSTPGYDDWTWEGSAFRRNGDATTDLPRFILVPLSPLVAYSGVPADLGALLAARYEPSRSFVFTVWDPGQVFDQQDAFYVPFGGLRGTETPGPNFQLYALRPGPSA